MSPNRMEGIAECYGSFKAANRGQGIRLTSLNGRVLVMSEEVADDQPINEVGNLGLLAAHRLNYLQDAEGHIVTLAAFQHGDKATM